MIHWESFVAHDDEDMDKIREVDNNSFNDEDGY